MHCMKCGREIQDGQVFCPDCLAVMAKHPVSPKAHAVIPRRPVKVQEKKPREIPPAEQIAGLKKATRRLWAAIVLLTATVGVLSLLLIQQYVRPDTQPPIGRNYTTADTN